MNIGATAASEALAPLGLFIGLPRVALREAAALARVRRFARETRVFNQGDPRVRAHVLIEGSVRISQTGSDGAQVVIRFIGAGDMFGAVALFTDGHYPADATTVIDSLEASWSEAELFHLMSRYPQIAVNIIRIVGRRLQEAQNRTREISTQRAEQRVAHALLRLAAQGMHSSDVGMAIGFPLRRKDVAGISGTTLYTASRILTAWEKAGLLTSRNQRLIIRGPSEIRRIAEESPG